MAIASLIGRGSNIVGLLCGCVASAAHPTRLRLHVRGLRALVIASLLVALGSPASAQYFGRNKVRYRSFDFHVMQTEHFDIYFYPEEREGIEIAARMAERWYSRLSRLLNHTLPDRQPLVLYASHGHFEQTNVVPDEIGEGTGGFTEPFRRRIVMPLAGPLADTDHVIGHELVHAFQFDIGGPVNAGEPAPLARLPLWFVEGMAEYLSLGRVNGNTAMKLRDAVARNELPSILDLGEPKYFPYQWGHAVFAYIAGRFGDQSISRLFGSAALSGDVKDAIETSLGISAQALTDDWHASIRELYGPILERAVALPAGDRFDVRSRLGSELNIAPALSPNGRSLAFLSSRSLFSTDLYVADAYSKRIVRRLTSTATNPHFSSIQFIKSAASWDKSGERVAIGAITAGRATLAIFNGRTGKREREMTMKGIDEVLNPSWAPDGHAIAFTGMRGGLTDLYVYELEQGSVRQLTVDAYADLQPAWSPDSRRIAFATERYSTDLESMRIGALRLAIIDAASGIVEPVPAFEAGKQFNPQWTADGSGLYFIADPTGVPNVYRRSLTSGRIHAVTAVGVGISGITASSPALSVSYENERMAVSVYEAGGFKIYAWSPDAPQEVTAALAGNGAALPPIDRTSAGVRSALARSDTVPPSSQQYPTVPYKPTMSLVAVDQPTAAAGISNLGPAVAGGAGFLFTDELNDRLLATGLQVGNGVTNTFSFKDVAFQAGYLRLDHRWQWSLVSGQIPYVTAMFESLPGAPIDGEDVLIDRETIYRAIERSSAAILVYPFNRARRLELRGGFAQHSFEKVINVTAYSLATALPVSRTSESHDIYERLDLAVSATALVSDATSFGPTGPIQGQRYRIEMAPTLGSVRFAGLLVDYRRYMMPVSFYTIATRFVHYSRLGTGGEDPRLQPVYINDPSLVRGYAPLALPEPCIVRAPGACFVEDRFTGSRMAVAGAELRFPLLRPFGASHTMYGPVPVEISLFADAGVAWNRGERPSIIGGSRPGITSTGLAARVGLGFGVLELDVVRPWQQPEAGWTFGINVMPGW
jgi:hypothetical protein